MDIKLLVKSLESGQYEASVLGLPAYRVEAASRELAIEELRKTFLNQVKDAEIVSLSLPIESSVLSDNPWKDLFGIFKDDAYFQEVVDIIHAERESLGEEEIDPAYYMPQNP